jgi:hypothetical protein
MRKDESGGGLKKNLKDAKNWVARGVWWVGGCELGVVSCGLGVKRWDARGWKVIIMPP